jgi:hypothetical protein
MFDEQCCVPPLTGAPGTQAFDEPASLGAPLPALPPSLTLEAPPLPAPPTLTAPLIPELTEPPSPVAVVPPVEALPDVPPVAAVLSSPPVVLVLPPEPDLLPPVPPMAPLKRFELSSDPQNSCPNAKPNAKHCSSFLSKGTSVSFFEL